jgi:hypothetical protein
MLVELYGQGENEVPKQSCAGPTMPTTNPSWYDPGFEAGDYRPRRYTTLGHKKVKLCTFNVTFWRVRMAIVAIKN